MTSNPTPITNTDPAKRDAVREAMKAVAHTSDPVALTRERHKTHGDWMEQSRLARDLKGVMHTSVNWTLLEAHQQEALEMICTKMSRILTGNKDEPDHYNDIAGYAHLGKGGHDQ